MATIGALPAMYVGAGIASIGAAVAVRQATDDPGLSTNLVAVSLAVLGVASAARGARQVYFATHSPLLGNAAELVADNWNGIRNARVGSTTLADALSRHVRIGIVGDGLLSTRQLVPETRAAKRLLDGKQGEATTRIVGGLIATRDDASASAVLRSLSFGNRNAIKVDGWLNLGSFARKQGISLTNREYRATVRDVNKGVKHSYRALNADGQIALGTKMSRQMHLELVRQTYGPLHPRRAVQWIAHPIARPYAPMGGRTHLGRTLGHELEHSLESGVGADPHSAEIVADLMASYNQMRIVAATGIPIDYSSSTGFYEMDGARRVSDALRSKAGMDDVGIYQYFNGKPVKDTIG
jgi:hypothetical protein